MINLIKNKQTFSPTCCYYPGTLLLLDDDRELLNDLSFALSSHYKCKCFVSSQDVINIAKNQGNTVESFMQRHSSTEKFDSSQTTVSVDIFSIKKELYRDPPRFSQFFILVVDFAMPAMNGLEVAKKIRQQLGLPIKVIMLTGEADQDTAIKAFNSKLIDRFIIKSCPDYIDQLLIYFHELHIEYFQDISNMLIEASRTGEQTARLDPVFINLFNETIHRYEIVEYYLTEEPCSFLMLDKNKNIYWLVLKTDEDMRMQYELASDDKETPVMVIEALYKREKLAFFPEKDQQQLPAKYWYLENAQTLQGENTYYYAIIEGTKNYHLKLNNVISYAEFLTR